MKLTPEILEATYALLAETEPFCNWPLPDATEVKFQVVGIRNHAADAQQLAGGQWCIRINKNWCSSLPLLIRHMAHEMCHVAHGEACPGDQAAHGKWFKALAHQVCKVHLLDYKAFC